MHVDGYSLFQETYWTGKPIGLYIVRHLGERSNIRYPSTGVCGNNEDGLTLFIWCVIDSIQFWDDSTRAIILASLARMTA